jgi:histone arginine demethylase JMJD6
LKYFVEYTGTNRDDSPLYVFDASFDEGKITKNLLDDFNVPIYFRDDLFGLVGEKRRPPYRWILIGPERSGSSLHIDPLATSAWNSLISGAKRWVLFKPGAPRAIVKGDSFKQKGEDGEAITYFTKILPRIKQHLIQEKLDFEMIEFIQYPGETVYVPGGWQAHAYSLHMQTHTTSTLN